jgi:putative transcriptional regulator
MKPLNDAGKKFSSALKVGSIVIAQPFWREEIYKRSVILITDYSATGTRGIIINKASNVHVYEVMDNPEVKINKRIYYGGPESVETVSYLHNLPSIPEADYFGNGIYYGGDPMSIEELIRKDSMDFRRIKFFVGYVEWTSGQLEFEIANNKWWVSDIHAQEIFNAAPENLWTLKLLQKGNLYGLFAEVFDPSLS